MSTRSKGNLAEEQAVEFLKTKGFEILEQNYYCLSGEIDIIAKDGSELVFVEVKSIHPKSPLTLFELVTEYKLRKLAKAINYWLMEKELLEHPWRVDYVGIVIDESGNISQLEHFPNLEL